jgi:hypothetical protein
MPAATLSNFSKTATLVRPCAALRKHVATDLIARPGHDFAGPNL